VDSTLTRQIHREGEILVAVHLTAMFTVDCEGISIRGLIAALLTQGS